MKTSMLDSRRSWSAPNRARGFTLVELMTTLVILALVVGALMTIMLGAMQSKRSSVNRMDASQAARATLDMIGRDMRSAGYGADLDYIAAPQPAISYIDSLQVLISMNETPFPDSSAAKGIPLAYNPNGTGKPFPLAGTAWEPPIRYRTGAETIRWTLDSNNDGVVTAADMGTEASRTQNPNDYELIRQVYGDSTGGTAGSNGPQTETMGLVSRPGGTVPPLFTVYLSGSTTPWNWSSGPVPAAQLKNIERVVVQVAAPSPKPDSRGRYASVVYRTDISSMRNTPKFGAALFVVDGYVYNDANKNHLRDGEPGLGGAYVTMKNYSTTTNSSGYFSFNAPAGNYTIRHTPPLGYGNFTSPDTFVVTVAAALSRSFADTARTGGWITANVFNDLNSNGVRDTGEDGIGNISVTAGSLTIRTDPSGVSSLFVPVGGYSVSCASPESLYVTTTNPVLGTMANGGAVTVNFGLAVTPKGTIRGTAFVDINKNGVMDGGESGLAGSYVAVLKSSNGNNLGYAYTDGSGSYSISVPMNDPPHTDSYDIFCIPTNGYFPTTTTRIVNTWLQANQTLSNNNFGMNSFQVVSVTANRVLSLASGDLIENDWGANPNNAEKDVDVVLGADANGTDQLSVWFNQYNALSLFTATPSYTRTAPGSVLSMALDTLDTGVPKTRLDLVAGTTQNGSGNFFVWINQNSTSNEGYFPTAFTRKYVTHDKGDVQAVLTADVCGGDAADMPDIIVGTKSPTANQGTVETWKSDNKATPNWGPADEYPHDWGGAGGTMGEVTSMVFADINGDGLKDLVVGTRTGNYTGEVKVLKRSTAKKSAPMTFSLAKSIDVAVGAVTAVAATDVDGDGRLDIIAGTQGSTSYGALLFFKNTDATTFAFNTPIEVDAHGIVMSLRVADLGGLARNDLIVGLRTSVDSYAGGVRIYYLDGTSIPTSGTDPSGGTIVNMVPAVTSGNYNYGIVPLASSPYLTDVAAGVKTSDTGGLLVAFIR